MQANYWADKALGYVQAAAGTFDTAKTIAGAGLTFPGQTAAGVPLGTQMLIIQPEVQAIRMRDDGTAPTAAVGYPVATGTEFKYSGALAALQIIGQVAGEVVNIWAFG